MLFVLVLIAGAVIAEAGIAHESNGLYLRHPISNSVRPAIRSQLVNQLGPSPALAQGSVFTNTFVSPAVFRSIYSNTAHIPKFRPLPTSYVGLRQKSTITHVSPPVLRNPLGSSLNSYVSYPVPNSSPSSHVIRHAAIPNLQTPTTVLTSAPIHQANGPELANTPNSLNSISTYKTVHVQEIPEKSISYSLSEQDYEYLKKHKIEGKDSPYNPDFVSDSASPIQYNNTHSHHDKSKDESSFHPPSSSDVLKRSAISGQAYSAYAEPSIGNTPEPVVVKYIYFHVPQPEFEEPPPTVNLPPPKKTYNILFIKAPTQESQNYAYLQQQTPQIEDKTLIYVLSKKQDPVQVVVPQQEIRPSSPEVYFVKYRTDSGDVDPRNVGTVVEESAIESISSVLDKRSVEKKPDCKKEKKTSS